MSLTGRGLEPSYTFSTSYKDRRAVLICTTEHELIPRVSSNDHSLSKPLPAGRKI